MGQNISEQRNPKLHSDLFKKNGKVLFGKKKFTIPPNADRPSATSKPEVFQESEQFVLRWDPPATDNGCPIIGYIIEHLELGLPQLGEKEVDETTQWYSSEPGQVTNTECILNNLIPGTTYQFRIVAENIIGYSTPSEISEPIVYNPFGELDDYFCIPKFLIQLDPSYTVMRGEKLTLNLEVEGQPYPIVHWFDKNEMEILALKTAFGRKRSLTFNSVDLQHAGKLTCSAENYMGQVTSSTLIVVEAPPHITSHYNEDDRHTPGAGAIFQAGELVRLKFNYSGAPSPTISLYRNGELVSESDNVLIENLDDNVVVKITNGTREDRGEYTIHLVNDLGEDSASVMLTITDRPSPPVSKPEVLQLSDNSCVLQWRDPEDDGGCPIQNFIVEYFRNGWGVWLKAVTTKGHSTKIRDLIPGSKYKFRVKAENLYGVSEASEESVEILITDLPSIIRSGDDGLMKTVEEEEMDLGEELEELKPPPIPPRTRESSAEKIERRASPAPLQPTQPLPTQVENISIPAPSVEKSPEKKLFSRREILGTPLNYLTLEPEIPVDLRPITPEKSPVDDELEKIKELLNEQSDYSEEEDEEEEEEFSYDYEKLQKEYEEDMMNQTVSPEVFNDEDSKRLPVFQEITDRWNTLTREMEGAIREYSVGRELEPEGKQQEEDVGQMSDPSFDYLPTILPNKSSLPRFEKSPMRKFEIRSQLDKEELAIPSPPPRQFLQSQGSPRRSPSPYGDEIPNRQFLQTEKSPRKLSPVSQTIPKIRSFVPDRSPIRFIDSPVEDVRKSPLELPEMSPVHPRAFDKRSFEPENSPRRSPQPPMFSTLAPSSFEPENSPYRELGRNRSPRHSPRPSSPTHSRSPSPLPQRRSSNQEAPVLLHDRFTDYLTMKVKDRKIASSLTNIHRQSRSRSTTVSPTRSSSSLLEDSAPPPRPVSAHYETTKMRRDRTADLQQKYNTVDNRRVYPSEIEDDVIATSKSYEYIDEVTTYGTNLVVTECSLTVPVTLRPGSRIELWRSDNSLDNLLDEEKKILDENERKSAVKESVQPIQPPEQQVQEEQKSRPRDYFKGPAPPKQPVSQDWVQPKTHEPRNMQDVKMPEPTKNVKMPEPTKEVKMPEPTKELKLPEQNNEVKIPELKKELIMPAPKPEVKVVAQKEELKLHEPQQDVRPPEPQVGFRGPQRKEEIKKKVEIVPEKKEEMLPDIGKWVPEEEDEVDEEWLRKMRERSKKLSGVRYIRHYEEMKSEEEESKKVKEIEEAPKITPEERAVKARRVRKNFLEGKRDGGETLTKSEERSLEEEEDDEAAEMREEDITVEVARESFLRRYYPTIIRTVLYMILSPLLLISVPVTLTLVLLIILSHYLNNKSN